MRDRPGMFLSFASSYSWSRVRPLPPCWRRYVARRCEEMSVFDSLDAVFASPERARALFTVRAAISSARFSGTPRLFSALRMCSYCRSRFGDDPRGMTESSYSLVYPTHCCVHECRYPRWADGQTDASVSSRIEHHDGAAERLTVRHRLDLAGNVVERDRPADDRLDLARAHE